MNDPRKQNLVDLGSEKLANALLNLAMHSHEADDLIEQLIATPKGNLQRYKKKLSSLGHSRRIVNWRGAAGFSRELEMLLQDLKSGVSDPLTGVELVAAFYEADKTIFEMCDDSSGMIGDVFRLNAKELFADYASRCADKEKIADIILKLNQEDAYGVRDALIECAGDCLPEEVIRAMIASLQRSADHSEDEYGRRHYLILVGLLARQIKDAAIFERARIPSSGQLSAAALIDISQVYLECGEVETAHSWLKKIPDHNTYMSLQRDNLLKEIYQRQGDTKKLSSLLFRKFRSYHCERTLQALLEVIGHDKRDKVIADEVQQILKTERLKTSDAEFLIEIGRVDEAEQYLIKGADQLNGDYYEGLLTLTEAMESEKRHLATSLIYRSLLDSILNRGYTKAYPHGVRYLKKLDKLSSTIADWRRFDHHEEFKAQIIEAHGRKRSFWSKYEVKK